MNILTTGGAGFVGSHTCLELLQNGFDIVAVDNLQNSSEESLNRVQDIAGKTLDFYQIDILDKDALTSVFKRHRIDAVIHFAGLKAVAESIQIPLRYYHNNITGTLVLCEVMKTFDVHTMVFSSSATVYGNPHKVPITEDFPLSAVNPYGMTKLVIEQILRDMHAADPSMQIAILRYFNPVGAHESGRIGEDPNSIPNNLFPYISQVAIGRLKQLSVYGADYPTKDGTGVRDYIHVVDLAQGHIRALSKLRSRPGLVTYNLGTGRGYSVLEVVEAFSKACGKPIPYIVAKRRPGDVAACYADPALANLELKWEADKGLNAMCADAWRWQKNNPEGYGEKKDECHS